MNTARTWRLEKSDLNHRFLQNQFILALGAAEADLGAGRFSVDLERELLEEVLPRWPGIRQRVERIIRAFEAAMSPAAIFDEWPLRGLAAADRAWLERLVVGLWRFRSRADLRLREIAESIVAIDAAVRNVRDVWPELMPGQRRSQLRELSVRCQFLARALSGLPAGSGGVA